MSRYVFLLIAADVLDSTLSFSERRINRKKPRKAKEEIMKPHIFLLVAADKMAKREARMKKKNMRKRNNTIKYCNRVNNCEHHLI